MALKRTFNTIEDRLDHLLELGFEIYPAGGSVIFELVSRKLENIHLLHRYDNGVECVEKDTFIVYTKKDSPLYTFLSEEQKAELEMDNDKEYPIEVKTHILSPTPNHERDLGYIVKLPTRYSQKDSQP